MRASRSMIASDPPQPPQKNVFGLGLSGKRGSIRPKPMPKRIGTFSTLSVPLHCSSRIRFTVASESSRTPSTAPPQASAECTRATERALPIPPPAGISARRQRRGARLRRR